MLERLHLGHNLVDSEKRFGWSYSNASRVFHAAEKWLVDTHGHRLLNLQYFVPKFPEYNRCIRQHFIDNNDVITPEAQFCVGFLDRTSIPIAKPDGPWGNQRLYWNYKAKCHCLAYQAVVAPDGMCMHFYGCVVGRRDDKYVLTRSGLSVLLNDVQEDNDIKYNVITDRGYEDVGGGIVQGAHRGPNVLPFQILDNLLSEARRIVVEWFFGKIKTLFHMLADKRKMQHQATPVLFNILLYFFYLISL